MFESDSVNVIKSPYVTVYTVAASATELVPQYNLCKT